MEVADDGEIPWDNLYRLSLCQYANRHGTDDNISNVNWNSKDEDEFVLLVGKDGAIEVNKQTCKEYYERLPQDVANSTKMEIETISVSTLEAYYMEKVREETNSEREKAKKIHSFFKDQIVRIQALEFDEILDKLQNVFPNLKEGSDLSLKEVEKFEKQFIDTLTSANIPISSPALPSPPITRKQPLPSRASRSSQSRRGRKGSKSSNLSLDDHIGMVSDGGDSEAGSSAQPTSISDSTHPNTPTSVVSEDKDRDHDYQRWKKSVNVLYKEIAGHRYANLFLHPVRIRDAPDYDTVIKRPTDLKTIHKQINDGAIKTTEEFSHAIYLMFINAIWFNEDGSQVNLAAKEMQAHAKERIEAYMTTIGDNGVKRRETREKRPRGPKNQNENIPKRNRKKN